MNEGRDLAKHLQCKFIETSAKQRTNVDEAFSTLVREIRRYNKEQQTGRPAGGSGPSGGYGSGQDRHEESSGCCGCCGSCVVL